MARLDGDALAAFLAAHPGWAVEGEELSRTFVTADFASAMAFVNRVAALAEQASHHPDISISWNRVTLRLSTHSEGGLTAKDTDLAAAIDGTAPADQA
jgi:4a-hydroxytetrahydrobiopterin dehydratase